MLSGQENFSSTDASQLHSSLNNVDNWTVLTLPGTGDEYLTDMVSDPASRMWGTVSGGGLVRFSKFGMARVQFLFDVEGNAVELDPTCVGVGISNGKAWIASTKRVFKCDYNFRKAEVWDYATSGNVFGKAPDQNFVDGKFIQSLKVLVNGDIWLALFGHGLAYGTNVN